MRIAPGIVAVSTITEAVHAACAVARAFASAVERTLRVSCMG